MKQPDQQLFDEIYKRISSLGYDIYLALPDMSAKYPFCVMGDTHLMPNPTKSGLIGLVSTRVHIWDDINNRRRLSDMIYKVQNELSKINRIENRSWSMGLSSNSQIIKDNSTEETLFHAVIDMDFKFV